VGTEGELLLHITTAAPWRVALAAGTLVTPSLVAPAPGAGAFIHLSRPDQVALPANRLYAGRDDLLLLVIDPGRLTSEVRWEPGVPTDPASMVFPHLYGPLPVAAVTSVVPWRPGPDGAFHEPTGLPSPEDAKARAVCFERSLSERRAAALVPVPGGMAVLDPRIARSYDHNGVWIDDDLDTPGVLAAVETAMAGLGHRRAVFGRRPPADLPWEVEEDRILVHRGARTLPRTRGEVVSVTREVAERLSGPSWRDEIPGLDEATLADLLRREPFTDAHLRVVDLAVLGDDGVPCALAQLRVDGATADIQSVMTTPAHRSRGLGTAVVVDALRRAQELGCDLVTLSAAADDWPRRWYERMGFVDVGARWIATRD
jgi:uncharacterized protein (DUF952 family)/GNAT superfamily N-acetyltransferase